MKKTIFIVLAIFMAGCSFSKHDDSSAAAAKRARVDEVMNDSRYTNLEKVEVAIRTGQWDIFQAALPKLSKEELNSLTINGETLGAVALKLNRVDFLEALLQAGMSPFRRSYNASYKSDYDFNIDIYSQALRSDNPQALAIVRSYRDGYLQEATKRCAFSTDSLIEFMDENYMSPADPVCGGWNLLIGLSRDKNISDTKLSEILLHFINPKRGDFNFIFNKILDFYLIRGDANFFRKLDVICGERGINCVFDFKTYPIVFGPSSAEKFLNSLVLMKQNMNSSNALVTEVERQIFTDICQFTNDDLNASLALIEKYGLKTDFETMKPEIEEFLTKKYNKEHHILPPPPPDPGTPDIVPSP